MSDTIGLTVRVAAETTDARRNVDELATYARRQLGSIPIGLGGGGPGAPGGGGAGGQNAPRRHVDKLLREMEREIRRAQNQMRGTTLRDVILGDVSGSAVSASLSGVRSAVSGIQNNIRNLMNQTAGMTNRELTRIERMWQRLEQTERLSKNIENRYNRVEYQGRGFTEEQRDPFYAQMMREKARFDKERAARIRATSLPILDNKRQELLTSFQRSKLGQGVPPELAKYLDEATAKQTEVQLQRLGGATIDKEVAKKTRDQIDELGRSFSAAFNAMPVKTKEATEALQRMRTVLGGLRNDVNQMDLARMKGNHNLGVFGNRGISGAFSLQQAVEDASYAGIRGAANNIAFFLAEMAPAGGPGAAAAGVGILTIMGIQIYDLGSKMGWWNKQAKEMADKARALSQEMSNLSDSVLQVSIAGASLGGQSALGQFSSAFMGPRGNAYSNNRNTAIRQMMQGPSGQQLLSAVSAAIQQNPSQFIGVGGVGVPSGDQNLIENALRNEIAALSGAASMAAGATNSAPGWTDWLMSLANGPLISAGVGAPGFNVTSSGFDPDMRRNKKGDAAKKRLVDALANSGPTGQRLSEELAAIPWQEVDFAEWEKRIKDALKSVRTDLGKLDDTQKKAAESISQNADNAAKAALVAAQSNDAVADSVQRVIEQNKELNAEYERQKAILREKAVLEDRNSFRSQGFDLMRSNSRRFMEQAGAPEWMIQNRERALYERQGSMLMGMADAAGRAGDMESRIKYLKELQALQMQYAGSTNNRMAAERTFESAIRVQQLIEESIRRNVDGSRQEYELIQNLANGVAGIRDIITSMPPIKLGTQQAIAEVNALQAALYGVGTTAAMIQLGPLPAIPGAPAARPAPRPAAVSADPILGSPVLPLGLNKGGHIPGYGGGDTVPALLEKGEFIINKAAVKALGVDTLHELNGAGSVRKFRDGGWSGTGYAPVYSTYSRSRYRNDRRQHGLGAHLRDYRGERPSVLARESVNEYHARHGSPTHKERLGLMNDPAMTAPIGRSSAAASRRPAGMPPMASPGVTSLTMRREGRRIVGVADGVPFARTDGLYADMRSGPFARRTKGPYSMWTSDGVGETNNYHVGTGYFPWLRGKYGQSNLLGADGLPAMSRGDYRAMMNQHYPGLSNSGPKDPFRKRGRSLTAAENDAQNYAATKDRILARSSNDEFHKSMWEARNVRYREKLQLRKDYQLRAQGNREAHLSRVKSRQENGFDTWRKRGMAGRGQGGWGMQGYVNDLFGPGFSQYGGWGGGVPGSGLFGYMTPGIGVFGNMGGVGGFGPRPVVQQYGLWDQGGLGMGGVWGGGGPAYDLGGAQQMMAWRQQQAQLAYALQGFRGFAGGGFVNPYSGTFISPDVVEERVGYERLGNWVDPMNAYNWNSFMMQRQRLLAGSRNAAYGGPIDFGGNTLGSFGRFSDGSFKSRFSGGFGSGMGGKGFSSMLGGGFGSSMSGGFSTFGRPIGAMTGGYITGPQQIQRYASGGSVGQSRPMSTSSIHNNFGEITIRVDSNDRAVDAAEQMRRAKSSYWAQRG